MSQFMMHELLRRDGGLLVIGSGSDGEHFAYTQNGSGAISESCVTAYLIRWLNSLMRLDSDLRKGDVMERAIYNALFAAQSPSGRQIRYFTPFAGPREYFGADGFCCPGNYRRIVAELPEMVYYKTQQGVAINLFTPSQKSIDLGGGRSVTIKQETAYPTSGVVKISLTPSEAMTFPLRLRIPRWCANATLSVNGGSADMVLRGGKYCEIHRKWKPGDTLTLDMPMTWRLVRGRRLQEGHVALLRGPVVYCIGTAQNGELLKKYKEPRKLIIDPASLGEPVTDASVRPEGAEGLGEGVAARRDRRPGDARCRVDRVRRSERHCHVFPRTGRRQDGRRRTREPEVISHGDDSRPADDWLGRSVEPGFANPGTIARRRLPQHHFQEHPAMRTARLPICSMVLTMALAGVQFAAAEEAADNAAPAAVAMTPIDLREIKIAGEIGRRIDITAYKNLLALNVEKDFLAPFRERNKESGYIGLGKSIDATVRFAAYTNDEKVRGAEESPYRRGHQDAGHRTGTSASSIPKSRIWGMYDIHEMSYLVLGLTNDYRYFGEKASLAAARKLADYIITRWSAEPSRIPNGNRSGMYGVTTGLDAALLTLYEQIERSAVSGLHRQLQALQAAGMEREDQIDRSPPGRPTTRLRLHGPVRGAVAALRHQAPTRDC